jgi:hypothetical protein
MKYLVVSCLFYQQLLYTPGQEPSHKVNAIIIVLTKQPLVGVNVMRQQSEDATDRTKLLK